MGKQGIISIRDRFRTAAKHDPATLSPGLLYPIIDAITVKRTRGFVKKYYTGETIRGADGVMRPIVFPKAVAMSVRYDLDRLAPRPVRCRGRCSRPDQQRECAGLRTVCASAFRADCGDDESEARGAAAGLLRSGLLKRFESSAQAFRLSLDRMLGEHDLFLDALAKGKVITTAFLRELSADDEGFDDLLDSSTHVEDGARYDVRALQVAVERDRDILQDLRNRLGELRDEADPKLAAVVEELARIAAEAHADATTEAEEQRDRKVLIFSFFSDTVAWLRRALSERIEHDPRLAGYRGRVAAVAGGGVEEEEASRNEAVWSFAPESSEPPPGQHDLYDLLITTDVLAEGMNLQQCRNIINYDLPRNPMRLVQRHGRIDRIGNPHPRVFMRTVFPADRAGSAADPRSAHFAQAGTGREEHRRGDVAGRRSRNRGSGLCREPSGDRKARQKAIRRSTSRAARRLRRRRARSTASGCGGARD